MGAKGGVLADLLDDLRGAVVAGLCGPNAPQLASHAGTREGREALAGLARRIGQARAELWLTDLLAARERLRLLPAHGRVVLEAALLEMARDESAIGIADLVQRLETLEERWGGAPAPLPAGGAASGPAPAAPGPPRDHSAEVKAPTPPRREERAAAAPPPAAPSTPAPTPTRPELRAEVSQGTATA